MSISKALRVIKEARRDALVDDYISNRITPKLANKVKNADHLYEYLLLDTKVSDLVITSEIAEAISSLQLFIHRCVEGVEGNLNNTSRDLFTKGEFLYNWDKYNRRYTTWSGKERLKYYAGSYIEPSLRSNKTQIFRNLEQSVNQGRLTNDSAKNAFQNYLIEYNNLSNLDYIHVNKGRDESTLFFVGRTKTIPYEYYWRSLSLKKNTSNKLIPDIWSEWKKIEAGISESIYDHVRISFENNRVHISWISKETTQGSTLQSVSEKYYYNNWILDSSGVWSPFDKISISSPDIYTAPFFTVNDVSSQNVYNGLEINNNILISRAQGLNFNIIMGKNQFFNIFYNQAPPNFFNRRLDIFINNTDNSILNIPLITERILNVLQPNTIYRAEERDLRGGNVNGPWLTFYYQMKTIKPLMYGSIKNNQFIPPSESNIKGPINLTLENNLDLDILFNEGLEKLYDYNVQKQLGGIEAFYGPLGMYIWEVFFHIPFLFAVRFLTEQRFEFTDIWLRFIFNSTGYRDQYGNLLLDEYKEVRYWNVVALQEDVEWNNNLSLQTTDPHIIAMADPMQYKLAIFLKTLDYLVNRGDHAFRQLERDTLTEARMLYIQASQLLGVRPEITINNRWPNNTLGEESNLIILPNNEDKLKEHNSLISFIQIMFKNVNGNFLPPYNEELLTYWDKINQRLFNLRHNLNLDGQPLNLPLFTTPTNPRELQWRFNNGDGVKENISNQIELQSVYRFPVLIEKARTSVSNLIQFGNSLQSAMEKQDSEKMILLIQSQQQTIFSYTQDIQEKNLTSLRERLRTIEIAKSGAEENKIHFDGLLQNWITPQEEESLEKRQDANDYNRSADRLFMASSVANSIPNIYGMAVGGVILGAVTGALAYRSQIKGNELHNSADVTDITEGYRRRKEEWEFAKSSCEQEVKQLNSEILSIKEQIAMAEDQIYLAEVEYANAQAVFELQSTRFTSQELYNWIVARLSTLYFQLYDSTVSLCIMSKLSFSKELGIEKVRELFRLPTWNDLYQGLLAGEILMIDLQRLENLWLEENKRGLEVLKTVSLDRLIRESNENYSFLDLFRKVLSDRKIQQVNGIRLNLENNIFTASLDLNSLNLQNSHNKFGNLRNIKSISVTLPALLGPYQDIEAILTLNGETIALSHGVEDSGLFMLDFNDARFLPFENMDATRGVLTLSIFQAEENGYQRKLVESINDIIFHIRYVIR